MSIRLRLAASAALACAVVAAGCGFGEGPGSEGTAYLTVTRDYGSERLVEASVDDPPESETVLRLLDSEARVTTRYGGGFVQSIEGVEGTASESRSFDWFFYVNGIESAVGAADARVFGGDRVWWDYREWTAAMRVPAVVGSWPEPFLHGAAGKAFPVRIDCYGAEDNCSAVADRLESEGVAASIGTEGATVEGELLRIVVGTWEQISNDGAAALIEDGPATSGVFADFELGAQGGYELRALDTSGEAAAELSGEGTGLVAAVREGDQQPAWVVTGSDESGVAAAVELLDEQSLRDRYAVAVATGEEYPLPVVDRRGIGEQSRD